MNQQQIIEEIGKKERELSKLMDMLETEREQEKEKIIKQKGWNRVVYLLNQEFESCSCQTIQYLEFHKIFKKEIIDILNPFCSKIEVSKPNHFDVSGFFQLNNGTIYYFRLEDLRWSKGDLLIRTAESFKDYTGGSNDFIELSTNFPELLKKKIGE